MKKLLALGLSLAMMASLTAVAFAEEETQSMTGEGDSNPVLVKTELVKEEYEDWTVTIPADQEVEWGVTDTAELPVIVSGKLIAGNSIGISATEITQLTNGSSVLPVEDWGVPEDLTATAEELAVGDVKMTYTATVNESAYDQGGLAVGVYSGQTTFTVTYNDATAGV